MGIINPRPAMRSRERRQIEYRIALTEIAHLRALVEELTGALKSIARNSCCGVCREAAAVAARTLGWYLCHKCGALNEIVNQCGCDPNNLPTRAKEGSGT